jgi:hypothetical protein
MELSFIKNDNFKESLFQIGYFFSLWNIFYFVIHKVFLFSKTRKIDLDIKNRIVSIMHGTLSFLFSTIFIYHFGINFDLPIDILSTKLVSLSLGYFLYDLIACLWLGLWDSKLIIHHILAISGFFFPFIAGKGIFAGIIGLFMAESSNFPMHFRVILKQLGLRHTKAYELFDDMYFAIYIFARGICSPIFCIMSFFSKDTPLFICFVFAAMTVQSLHFIKIMFKILKKKNKEKLERKSKGVELFWTSMNPKIEELSYFKKKSKSNIF